MAYKDRGRRDAINVRDYGITGDPAVLIGQPTWNKIFDAAKTHNREVVLPAGKFVMPADFTYNFGLNPVRLIGEGAGRTIITSKMGSNTMRIVERIDITLPKTQPDGFYRIDRIGVNHANWSALSNPDIDDYIKIVGGVPSFATLAEVKAANLVTELDVTQPDPGIDGIYVVATIDQTVSGGGYTHSDLPYAAGVKIVTGTILKRVAGVWSRLAPSKGFEFGGEFLAEGITFEDCSFYLFTPNNQTTPDFNKLKIHKCKFNHVPRVISLDRQFAATAIQSQGFMKGLNYHFIDGERFNYKNIEITENEFSYIHTSIMWECPPTKRLFVHDNYIHDCYTHTEMFIYLPMSSIAITDPDDDEGYTNKTDITYTDNVFRRVRHYSPVSVGGHHLMRGNGQAIYRNNRVYESTGSFYYITGNNNTIDGNISFPYAQSYPAKEGLTWGIPSCFHIKSGNQNQVSTTVLTNNRIEKSALMRPVDLKGTDTNLIIANARFQSFGWAEQLLPTDTELNKELMYLVKDVSRLEELLGTIPEWTAADRPSGKYVMFETGLYVTVAKVTAADGNPTVATTKYRVIANNSYIYWDIRRTAWMHWPSAVNRQISVFEKNYDNKCLRPIRVSNSILLGYSLVQVTDGTVEDIEFSNSTIYAERDIFTQSVGSTAVTGGYGAYVGTMTLSKCHIYRGWNSVSTRYFNSIKRLITSDCQFYYTALQFNIEFREECQWINNHVKPWDKYMNAEVVELLGLPLSTTPVAFKRVLPAAWTDTNYTAGQFRSYNGQAYESIDIVTAGDGNPATATTKWKLVDNPSLTIQGGSLDSYLARSATMTWANINNVSIKGPTLKCKLVKDWVSTYNTRRFAIILLGPSGTTKDLQITDVKFEFDNKANRYLFYVGQSGNVQTIENMFVKGIGNDPLPLTNMYYTDALGSMVVTKLLNPASEIKDTAFEALVTTKNFGKHRITDLEVTGSIKAPYLAGVVTQMAAWDTEGNLTAAPVPAGGTGGGDLSSNTASTAAGQLPVFADASGKVIGKATQSGFMKLVNGITSWLSKLSIVDDTDGNLPVSRIDATGTRDNTTVLHGDGAWRAPAGGGGGGTTLVSDVDFIGTGTDGDLLRLAVNSALQDSGSDGIPARIGPNTTVSRSMVGTAGYLDVLNGNGKNGNPTFTLGTTAKGVVDGTKRVMANRFYVTAQTHTVSVDDVNLINGYIAGNADWTLPALGTATDRREIWIMNKTANIISLNLTVYEGATGLTFIPAQTNCKLIYDNTTGVNKIFIFKFS